MNSPATPVPARSRLVSLIWLVPIVALVASAWLVMRQFREHGPVIEIVFENGAGIDAGTTPLVYKGVVCGVVKEVALNEDLNGVTVRVELKPSAEPLAVEGSQFWIVRPEIGLSGVKGIETLLSGAQLRVRAGSGAPAWQFRALSKSPSYETEVPGRHFVLRSTTLAGLNQGSPVYFRDMKVGAVEEYELSPDATRVLITVNVHEPYHAFVRPETQFWNSGGINVKLGLLGAELRSNSLESFLSGGVAFATPDESANGEPAPEGTVFELRDEVNKDWLKWEPKFALPEPEAPLGASDSPR
ncbi:MAG TPA: MlaD family protein [Opitutaceae bacterium]|nr:MlaD family protein [Opitutaceae bacterium]